MDGEFGGKELAIPGEAKGIQQVVESYMPGPMAQPIVFAETSGSSARATVLGGMTIRQQLASAMLAGVVNRDGGHSSTNVAETVDFALRLTDALMFRTMNDVALFKENVVERSKNKG